MNQESRKEGKVESVVPNALSRARAIGEPVHLPIILIDLYV